MSVRTRSGDVSVEVNGTMLDLSQVPRLVAPRIVDAFERVADDTVAGARRVWPVRTGRSRDGFQVRSELRQDAIATVVTNTAPYAYKIRARSFTQKDYDDMRANIESKTGPGWNDWNKRRALEALDRRLPVNAEDVAGKNPWQVAVRKPIRDAEKPLAEELEEDLRQLCGGT